MRVKCGGLLCLNRRERECKVGRKREKWCRGVKQKFIFYCFIFVNINEIYFSNLIFLVMVLVLA